jgi:small subunit ribosomal protein S16
LAVHIRLRRMGKKKQPYYRIVAADSRRARDGKFLETIGTYNPITKPAEVKIDEALMARWLDQGALPSDTVSSLMTQVGFTEKYLRAKKGEDVSTVTIKTQIKERPKKTRRMKKAAVAAAETAEAPTEAAGETPAEG